MGKGRRFLGMEGGAVTGAGAEADSVLVSGLLVTVPILCLG